VYIGVLMRWWQKRVHLGRIIAGLLEWRICFIVFVVFVPLFRCGGFSSFLERKSVWITCKAN